MDLRALLLGSALACACSHGSAEPSPSPPTDPAPLAETRCGANPFPDCPLQAWMKANALTALNAGDYERLAQAFRRMPSLGPKDYGAWSDLATAGAAAADAKDFEAARGACKKCHEEYRQAYRRDHRTRALP